MSIADLFAHWRPRNPARELALIGVEKRKQSVREKTRQIRRELNLPPLPALER